MRRREVGNDVAHIRSGVVTTTQKEGTVVRRREHDLSSAKHEVERRAERFESPRAQRDEHARGGGGGGDDDDDAAFAFNGGGGEGARSGGGAGGVGGRGERSRKQRRAGTRSAKPKRRLRPAAEQASAVARVLFR